MSAPRIIATPGMHPFRAVARLGNEVATYDGRIALDGLLEWAAWQEQTEDVRRQLPPPNLTIEPVTFEVPCARWVVDAPPNCPPALLTHDGQLWGWCASFGFADWIAEGTVPVRKRTPVAEMARWSGDRSKLDSGAGKFKAWDLPQPTRLAREVVFYGVGLLAPIRRMLSRVHSLGRKRGLGCGQIAEWAVESWPHDWSCVRDGEPTRPLPSTWPGLVRCTQSLCALRAPYWHAARQMVCVGPEAS